MHTHKYIHIRLIQFLIIHFFRILNQPCQLIILEPRIWNSVSHHYHATLIPTFHVSCRTHTKTHHFNFVNHLIQLSCSHHVKTHKSQLTHHLIHTGHSAHELKGNTPTSMLSTFEIKEASRPTPFSPSISLRQKGLA